LPLSSRLFLPTKALATLVWLYIIIHTIISLKHNFSQGNNEMIGIYTL